MAQIRHSTLATGVDSNDGKISKNAWNEDHVIQDLEIADVDGLQTALDSKEDVLGFTPYNATNPSGYISSISGGMVTVALGYTPTSVTGLTGIQSVAAFKTGLTLVKADVGLGNVDNTSDANKPVSTAQAAALALKAPLASPPLTGVPTAPSAISSDNSTQIATTAFVQAVITDLIAMAPGTLNTLDELANALGDDPSFATTVTTALATKLVKANNLSDLTNVVTARGNLGLGSVDNTSDAAKNAAAATLTNKTIALGSNTVSGTLAEFNAALTGADFATGGGTATGTNTGDQTSIVGITGTKTQFDTAVSDDNIAFLGSANVFSGATSFTAAGAAATAQVFLNGSGRNWLGFASVGTGAPAFTTRSAGTKIVLYPLIDASNVDYAIGVDGNTLWHSVPNAASDRHRFYGGTTLWATINTTGLDIVGKLQGDTLQVDSSTTPATAGATGTTGTIAWDANYIYVCIATNTWRRVAHATW